MIDIYYILILNHLYLLLNDKIKILNKILLINLKFVLFLNIIFKTYII